MQGQMVTVNDRMKKGFRYEISARLGRDFAPGFEPELARAILRHVAQVRHNCEPGNPTCRPRQRQTLLQWAYDSRKI